VAAIPEELIVFIQVLGEDEDLRAWFDSFAETPSWRRIEEFRQLAARMHAGGEHRDLVTATAMLAEPGIYEAVVQTLAEQEQ
jgi:hypothetical protein